MSDCCVVDADHVPFSDRGGTFCDVWAHTADGKETVFKLLSVDPSSYPDAPTEGIRRVLEQVTGQSIPKGQPIDGSLIESVRVGTTVATKSGTLLRCRSTDD